MPRTATSELAGRIVGQAVRTARLEASLRQTELAARLGVSPTYIANVEAGRTNLTIGQLASIARAMETEMRVRLLPVHVEPEPIIPPPGPRRLGETPVRRRGPGGGMIGSGST